MTIAISLRLSRVEEEEFVVVKAADASASVPLAESKTFPGVAASKYRASAIGIKRISSFSGYLIHQVSM